MRAPGRRRPGRPAPDAPFDDGEGDAPARLDGLLRALSRGPAKAPLRWLDVSQGQNVRLVTVEEVRSFKSDNKYTLVVTADRESLIKKTVRELVDALDPDTFWQIHRGTLVNINAIAAVHRHLHGNLEVRLKDRAETLAVSTPYAHLFRQM